MDSVAGFRTDDMNKINAFFGQCDFHHISSLFLNIIFTAIGNQWNVCQIDGIIIGIIPTPKFLFPPIGMQCLLLEGL